MYILLLPPCSNPGRAGEEAAVVLQNIQFGNHGRKEGKIHFDNSTTFSTSSAIYNPYSGFAIKALVKL